MAGRSSGCDLAPPEDVVLGARAVMGSVDLDPYSTKDINRLVMAAKYYNRDKELLEDIVRKDWDARGEKRVLVAPPAGAGATRRLINKTLVEYRKGRINEAILWLAHNETIIKAPWLWDFPICIPFRRLIIYLPPPEDPMLFQTKLSRFHTVFTRLGRIVFNQFSGEGDWEDSYKVMFKRSYNYRE
jgi:hypothetical protein